MTSFGLMSEMTTDRH